MRRTAVVAALVAVLVGSGVTAAASAAPAAGAVTAAPAPAGDALLRYDESGCTEVGYERGGLATAVRALVPERFELVDFPTPEGQPARVRLLISEFTCDRVATDGSGRTQRHVSGLIVSADTRTIDGQPSDGVYVLFWATENPLQNDRLNALGWPSDALRRSSGVRTTTSTGGLSEAVWTFTGDGWDHRTRAASIFGFGEPTASTAVYYRDTPTARLRMCYANSFAVVPGAVTADLSTTPLAAVTAVPPVYAGFPASLVSGGWTATLTAGACPAADSASGHVHGIPPAAGTASTDPEGPTS